MPSPSAIVLIGTGGTISGWAAEPGDNVGYTVGKLGTSALAGAVTLPEGFLLETEQVAAIDSKDMDFSTWRRLALAVAAALARAEVAGVVVTHGTDTLEETAWFLHRVVNADRPVVLTGAMRPASSRQADGAQNVADSVAVVAAGGQGVVVAIAGAAHSARDVRKHHPYRLDAFGSGDAGVLGYVEEGRLRSLRAWPVAEPLGVNILPVDSGSWPVVGIVASGAGVDRRSVSALVDAGFAGLVVATTGNGTIHCELEAALHEAVRRGVAVVRATRCLDGVIVGASGENSSAFEAIDLTPAKARVELLLRLLARDGPGPATSSRRRRG